jgi:peptidylprolyl isomerase
VIRKLALAFACCAALIGANAPASAQGKSDPQNTLIMTTKDGDVTIALRPDLAPKHVAQIKALVKRKFYDGLTFHRVIAGFMAQTGDPSGDGSGGSDLPNIPAEFSTSAHFVRGTVGMARTNDPNSANSQFFICFAAKPFLDGKYTIFGEVVAGMDVIDKIKKGSDADNGAVTSPDKIMRMRLASDPK